MPPPRVAFYGHDTVGLGHLRRNLALAATVTGGHDRAEALVVSGAAEARAYDLPPGVDLVTVPAVGKDADGRYHARRLRSGLDAVLALRRATITAALDAFAPDLLVIDKVPFGVGGELRPVLTRLGRRTRVVLGLRDVLDEPAVARAEWRRHRVNDALRHHVDEVWAYGDRAVHDLGEACAVPPSLRRRFRYTGYLSTGRAARPERPPGLDARAQYVLCTVGGGQDGGALARAFARARWPEDVVGVLVTGPQMAAAERAAVERAATGRRDLVTIDFHPHVDRWMAGAAAVVAMGGYNTVAEVLATTTPALVVPRTRPRAEQRVRAEALAAHGHVDHLDAPGLDGPTLSRWLHGAVARPPVVRRGVRLDGLATVAHLSAALLDRETPHAAAV